MRDQQVPSPPTMVALARVLPQYGEFRFDLTLEAARHDVGNEPDLADPAHAMRLRRWLNQWICRIGYPRAGEADVFVGSLASWWIDVKDMLPADTRDSLSWQTRSSGPSARLTRSCTGAPRPSAGRGRSRSVGPTAAAKLLYFVRPLAVTAWDNAISARTGRGDDEAAFLRHLTSCRSWAQDLEAEAGRLGLEPSEMGVLSSARILRGQAHIRMAVRHDYRRPWAGAASRGRAYRLGNQDGLPCGGTGTSRSVIQTGRSHGCSPAVPGADARRIRSCEYALAPCVDSSATAVTSIWTSAWTTSPT